MDYIIGAGAILQAGQNGTISPATLHAAVDPALGAGVAVAAIDFESSSPERLQRLVVALAGWDAARFAREVSAPLLARAECSLAGVLQQLADAAGTRRVDLFANWLPGESTVTALVQAGIELVAHPLEAIQAASLVAGTRCTRWRGAPAA